MRRFPFALLVVLLVAPVLAQQAEIEVDHLERDVAYLADDARQGRRAPSDGWKAAGQYVADAFKAANLAPAGDDGTYFQAVADPAGLKAGRNVVAVLAAAAPTDEHIVIGAHYDHLGVDAATGEVYNGADDNASGTAALMELARYLSGRALARHVVFVAFDLEEQGLVGSRAYVGDPHYPIESCVAMICIDMLGRSVLDQLSGTVVALGCERSRAMRAAVDRAAEGADDQVWHLGTEYVGPRSDFVAFAAEEVPYVFLTTATHRDYHMTSDDAGLLDYESLAGHTRLAAALALDLATADEGPTWTGNEPDRRAEARSIAGMTGRILENADALREGKNRVTSVELFLVRQIHRQATRLLDKERINDLDRATLLAGCYVLVLGVVDDNFVDLMRGRIERFFGR